MTDNPVSQPAHPTLRTISLRYIGVGIVATSITVTLATAQQSTTNPAAASGMTTGLPGAYDARDLEMQQVRAASNAARRDAKSAALVRSADRALEAQQFNTAVANQRANKLAKERAAEAARLQKAANAYNRVSLNQIQTWSNEGGVKIERNIPPQVMQQIADNDVAEAEAALEEAEKERSPVSKAIRAPGNAVRGVIGKLPFGKKDEFEEEAIDTTDAYADGERKGLFKRVGGVFKRSDEVETAATNAPQPQTGASDLTEDINAQTEKKGLMKGLASKIPFVGKDKRVEVAGGEDSAPVPTPANPVQIPAVSATGEGLAQVEAEAPKPSFGPVSSSATDASSDMESIAATDEKSGLFSRVRNRVSSIGNGQSLRNSNGSSVDASLFPDTGDIPQIPAGTERRVDSSEMLTGTPGGSTAGLPQAEGEKKGLLSGITSGLSNAINRNDDPNSTSVEAREPKQAIEKKPRTTVHSGGNSVYVVANDSKFFRFGDTQFSSEVNDIAAGTIVQMVKAGDEWCSVRLSSGATGNVKNKDLQPASPDQVGAATTFGPQTPNTTSAVSVTP